MIIKALSVYLFFWHVGKVSIDGLFLVVWHVKKVAKSTARNVIALLLTDSEWLDECCAANGRDVRGRTWELRLEQGVVMTSSTIVATCKELKNGLERSSFYRKIPRSSHERQLS